jgi:hypothetical protein
VVELQEGGDHVNHRILRPTEPQRVEGIRYPHSFKPLQDIWTETDFRDMEAVFSLGVCDDKVREFWLPFFRPRGGDTELLCFTKRLLQMEKVKVNKNIHQVLDYGHSFDPVGKLGGLPARSPRIWVPDIDWFDPVIQNVTFADIFTIFPYAEQQMLKLILGRIGVGRANHLPPGWIEPVDHTARMAAVIVGKDAGLGKSTLFNGMTAAFQKCGFVTNSFKSTKDRFGLKAAALSDIAYKDDTSISSLKEFLSSEETKILITNGLFTVEEKFQNSEQIWPKTTIIVNSNEWKGKFAYDLDPGITDRIKIISTCREHEVKKMSATIGGISEGSPDLRPRAHIPYLAKKLNVHPDALYLWCLRIATDEFWKIISDKSDPTVNRLQVEVRKWTTRQRIRFKSDVTQALINAIAFAYAVKTKAEDFFMLELTPHVLYDYFEAFYFVGVDPSCYGLCNQAKKEWEKAGRPSAHYWQGFREIRWESIKKILDETKAVLFEENSKKRKDFKDKTALNIIKEMMEKIVMRDGFQIGGEGTYVIENWENCRYGVDEIAAEAKNLVKEMEIRDVARLHDLKTKIYDKWLDDTKYSPDTAEKLRHKALSDIYKNTTGV